MTSKLATRRLRYVLWVLIVLIVIAIPVLRISLVRSKEYTLKNQLYTLRFTIDEYTFDKKHPPQSLGDLVQAGYLREIPTDPMTASDLTWLTSGQPAVPGIVDVQSGSKATSLDGVRYSEW